MATWDDSMTQAEMMESDQCILLSPQDGISGFLSKVASHRFLPASFLTSII